MTATWLLCWLILVLGLSGWWCDCCAEPSVDCMYCAEQDATISVTIGGFNDAGYCACSNLNGTYVLELVALPYDPCAYTTFTTPFECETWLCREYVSGIVRASVGVGLGGNYYWFASLSITYKCPLILVSDITWTWNSGATTPFDCTATRTLTRNSIPSAPVCVGWESASCQIN